MEKHKVLCITNPEAPMREVDKLTSEEQYVKEVEEVTSQGWKVYHVEKLSSHCLYVFFKREEQSEQFNCYKGDTENSRCPSQCIECGKNQCSSEQLPCGDCENYAEYDGGIKYCSVCGTKLS